MHASIAVANACTTPISAQGSTCDATRHPPTFLSRIISQLFSGRGGGGGRAAPSKLTEMDLCDQDLHSTALT